LAALHHREKTGEGQVVDSALYEAVLQVMESLVPEYAVSGHVRERSGSVLPGVAPSNVYRCKDGEYLIGANQDTVFVRLCRAMARPDLAEDPRFATHLERGFRQAELDRLIEDWTQTLTVSELEQLMIEHGVPAGRIYRAAEMLADPHFAAREALVSVDHPKWPGLVMQNAFPKLSVSPASVRSIAPQTPGQHNREVYGELLGIGTNELERLGGAGVI
jgi:formyl-CoA transferase